MHTTFFAGDSLMPPDTAFASISQEAQVLPQAAQFVTPNLYQLAGDGIHFSLRTEGFRAPSCHCESVPSRLSDPTDGLLSVGLFLEIPYHCELHAILAVPIVGKHRSSLPCATGLHYYPRSCRH